MSLFLSCIFYLLHRSEKYVTERNKRLSLWSLFANWGTQLVHHSCWLNQSFLSNEEDEGCFLQPNILSNYCNLPKVSKNKQLGSILTLLSVLSSSKSANWTVWKSIYPVMEKLETSNFDSRQTSFKGFYWVTRLQRYWPCYFIFTWLWQISLSLVTGATVTKYGQ